MQVAPAVCALQQSVCALSAVSAVAYAYVSQNHRILRVSLPGGEIETLAGSEERGMADGSGSEARFNCPRGVALLGDDTLVVCDHSNHRLRAIDLATREVTTLAGNGEQGHRDGRASDAQLCFPVGVVVRGAGRGCGQPVGPMAAGPEQSLVFVTCEQGDCRGDTVRVLTAQTGDLYTLKLSSHPDGGGDGGGCLDGGWGLDYPGGLALVDLGQGMGGPLDPLGPGGSPSLFVADRVGHSVRRVSIAGEDVGHDSETIATAAAGGSRAALGRQVWTVAGGGGRVGGHDGPGELASFFRPRDLVVASGRAGADRTLFVTDGFAAADGQGQGRIRWIRPPRAGLWTEGGWNVGTVRGLPRLSDPRGIAILPAGQLLVADHQCDTLWWIDLNGARQRRTVGAAQRLVFAGSLVAARAVASPLSQLPGRADGGGDIHGMVAMLLDAMGPPPPRAVADRWYAQRQQQSQRAATAVVTPAQAKRGDGGGPLQLAAASARPEVHALGGPPIEGNGRPSKRQK